MINHGMFANIVDVNKIHVPVIGDYGRVTVCEGERALGIISEEMISVKGNLDEAAVPTLAITLGEEMRIDGVYTVEVEGIGCGNAVPMGIFDTEYFNERYLYDGDDLGAIINGDTTTFKVWAPTASKVVLNLYKDGKKGVSSDGDSSHDMTGGTIDDKGVWSITVPNCPHGTFYTYTVSTSVGVQETIDPYAKAAPIIQTAPNSTAKFTINLCFFIFK